MATEIASSSEENAEEAGLPENRKATAAAESAKKNGAAAKQTIASEEKETEAEKNKTSNGLAEKRKSEWSREETAPFFDRTREKGAKARPAASNRTAARFKNASENDKPASGMARRASEKTSENDKNKTRKRSFCRRKWGRRSAAGSTRPAGAAGPGERKKLRAATAKAASTKAEARKAAAKNRK